MAIMAKIAPGPTAARCFRGERFARGTFGLLGTGTGTGTATRTRRSVATGAVARERGAQYAGEMAATASVQERKEAIRNAKPFSEFLTDSFARQHDYLRISITERCNLRCLYCMPEEGVPLSPAAHMLTTPEIFYLSSLFVSQGVTKIRLTGGEPTVRRDIIPLMQQIGSLRASGLRELALTTNGISLHRKLDAMVEAGLTGVNLSLDTLDPFQFQIMTRRKGFDAVMKSIDRILEMNKMGANVKLKVNCVVMRGLNERDIIPFVELGREKDIEVRFIEYMPFGGNKWSQGKMIGLQEMLGIIRAKYPGLSSVPGHKNDTSKTYAVPGFVGKVGFITSMTNDFCGSCNRLRITSDGNLKVCLHGNDEVSLRHLLRQDNNGEPIDQEAFERIKQVEMDRRDGRLSDETILGWGPREQELLNVIGQAVKRKAEKHADMGDLKNMTNRPMILIDQSSELHVQSQSANSEPAYPQRRPTSTPRASLVQPWPSILAPRLSFLFPFLESTPSHVRSFSTSLPSRDRVRDRNLKGNYPTAENQRIKRLKGMKNIGAKVKAIDVKRRKEEQTMLMALSGQDRELGDLDTSDERASRRARMKQIASSIFPDLEQENHVSPQMLSMTIRKLKARIALERAFPPNGPPPHFEVWRKDHVKDVTHALSRILWRRRRRDQQLIEKHELAAEDVHEEWRLDVMELEVTLALFQAHLTKLKTGSAVSQTMSDEIEYLELQRWSILEDRRNSDFRNLYAAARIKAEALKARYDEQRRKPKPPKPKKGGRRNREPQSSPLVRYEGGRRQGEPQSSPLVRFEGGTLKLDSNGGGNKDKAITASTFGQMQDRILDSGNIDTSALGQLRARKAALQAQLRERRAASAETHNARLGGSTGVLSIEDGARGHLNANPKLHSAKPSEPASTSTNTNMDEYASPVAQLQARRDELVRKRESRVQQLQAHKIPGGRTNPDLQLNNLVPEPALSEAAVEGGREDTLQQLRSFWEANLILRKFKDKEKIALEANRGAAMLLELRRQKMGEDDEKDADVHDDIVEEPGNTDRSFQIRKTNEHNVEVVEPKTTATATPTPTKSKGVFGAEYHPPYPRSTWPEPPRKPLSESLRADFPASGLMEIDPNFTVNIEAPTPELQAQTFQMRERLRNAYPRIDTLPYDVWTSSNRTTLSTWLRILVNKWKTRFDVLPDSKKESEEYRGDREAWAGEEVKAVLDQMVKNHDLSAEGAKRMARRWQEVFERRRVMGAELDVEQEEIDWEEWDAGLGWLRDGGGDGSGREKGGKMEMRQQGNDDMKRAQTDEKREGTRDYVLPEVLPFTRQNKKENGFRRAASATNTAKPRLYEMVARRGYSTSTRPPLSNTSSPSATDNQKPTSAILSTSPQSLPHLTPSGTAHMVSVSTKPHTLRTAIAAGIISFSNPVPLALIRANAMKKGDVLSVSRIAGIMAAKRCPDLIPLCHPIMLTHVGVELGVFGGAGEGPGKEGDQKRFGGVTVEARVQCEGQTGVEMEALTSVMGAALSVVDMCKAVDKGMSITDVRVVLKEGGRSGVWREEGWKSVAGDKE